MQASSTSLITDAYRGGATSVLPEAQAAPEGVSPDSVRDDMVEIRTNLAGSPGIGGIALNSLGRVCTAHVRFLLREEPISGPAHDAWRADLDAWWTVRREVWAYRRNALAALEARRVAKDWPVAA